MQFFTLLLKWLPFTERFKIGLRSTCTHPIQKLSRLLCSLFWIMCSTCSSWSWCWWHVSLLEILNFEFWSAQGTCCFAEICCQNDAIWLPELLPCPVAKREEPRYRTRRNYKFEVPGCARKIDVTLISLADMPWTNGSKKMT